MILFYQKKTASDPDLFLGLITKFSYLAKKLFSIRIHRKESGHLKKYKFDGIHFEV